MANSKIEDVAGNINLGENKVITTLASDATTKPGMGVYRDVSSGAKSIEGLNATGAGLLGVAGVNYDMTGMEYPHKQHGGMPVYTEGKVTLRFTDPGADKLAGAGLYLSGASAGYFGWYDIDGTQSGQRVVAKIIENVANGDTVGKARLI